MGAEARPLFWLCSLSTRGQVQCSLAVRNQLWHSALRRMMSWPEPHSSILTSVAFPPWPWHVSGASLVTQMVKNPPQCRRPGFDPWVRRIPCRRQWLPTPIFLAGESLGQRSLEGYSPWGCKESDTTKQLTFSHWHLSSRLKMENFFFYIGEQFYLVVIFIFKMYLFLIEGYLLYNIVLVSATHQHDSAIGVHTSPPSWPSLPPPPYTTP